MKHFLFKAKLIEIMFPRLLEDYEQELIPIFKDISKPFLQSIIIKDEGNPIQNNDWAYLYFDEQELYEQPKTDFLSEIIPSGFPPIGKAAIFEEINDEFAEKILNILSESMQEPVLEQPPDAVQVETTDEDDRLLVQVSIAQLYNALSIIQNGLRIGDLLKEFLEEDKQLSLVKAVKVDPSVLELQQIKNKINQLDPIVKNKLDSKLQNAKSIPHLTPHKNRKYFQLGVFLNFTASIGYLSNSQAIPNKTLQEIATNLEIIPEDFDPNEFRKICSYYRNR